MARLILYANGAYNLYSTVADGVCFEEALTLEQLTYLVKEEEGEAGLRELGKRLERAHLTGCSSRTPGMSLEHCITGNRQGPNDTRLSPEEFIARYLTLRTDSQDITAVNPRLVEEEKSQLTVNAEPQLATEKLILEQRDEIARLQARVAELERLDAQAATHVESVICLRTSFSGEPPYVGWKGLGLALIEALDQRDALQAEVLDYRAAAPEPFQARVRTWLNECFGRENATDPVARNQRFLEEAIELVQACGCTREEALRLVDYVYGRPVGERSQEVGGVMLTLAALCLVHGIDLQTATKTELARAWSKIEVIRAKMAEKPKIPSRPQSSASA